MTIPELSMSMATSQLQTNFSTAMLGKQMDVMESQGTSLINMMDRSMMETSVNPNLGANLDLTV